MNPSLASDTIIYIPIKRMKLIIALDDWGKVLSYAAPVLTQLAEPALMKAATWSIDKIQSWLAPYVESGADSGGWIGDYSTNPMVSSKQFSIQDGNNFGP